MNQGLIGTWSPGIGDPSFGGWLTVALYAAAAWATWRVLRDWDMLPPVVARREKWFWHMLFLGLVMLGINKQLDLQSALTEIGRMLADQQGWYENRRQVQVAFIVGIGLMGGTVFAATLNLIWGAPAATLWALLGSAGLMLFVVIRAASFHHIDEMLGRDISGLRINWMLEMGMLLVIIASAWRRRGQA